MRGSPTWEWLLALSLLKDETFEKLASLGDADWYIEDGSLVLHETQPTEKPSLLDRILGRSSDASASGGGFMLDAKAGEGHEDDLDKSWHVLHYCLTGDLGGGTHPLGFIAYGGRNLPTDLGYGPPRVFSAEEASKVHSALSQVSHDDLKAQWAKIGDEHEALYLGDVIVEEGDEGFEYITQNFDRLQKFVNSCAEHQLGFMTFIS